MMEEPTLRSQTNMIGEAMRSYRSFGLPGMDLLCDAREFNTAKQCQSAAHQYGREGMLSELYGVTGWDFPLCDHKLQGDWQAALGVTLRVPHLYWASMEGEAKRDYPASIGHQSPWFEQYPMVEDHFARLNTALTRGQPHVRLGVIHPIESFWLHYGPLDHAKEGEAMERRFAELTDWLLYGLVDFDFLCESLLPLQYTASVDGKLHVGEMAYDAVLVPSCDTLRSTTLDALERFAAHGGRVLFTGEPPRLTDALPSTRPGALAQIVERICFDRDALLGALEPVRELDIRTPQGERSDNLIYQMRDDGADRWLFVCHVRPPVSLDDPPAEQYLISIPGGWKVTCFDTMTGEISSQSAAFDGDKTCLEWNCFCHDSLLLRLSAVDIASPDGGGKEESAPHDLSFAVGCAPAPSHTALLGGGEAALPITLSEPNALLIDRAEWRLDDGDWQPEEDILRIDNRVRELLSLPRRCNSAAQPWLWSVKPAENTLCLRALISSELALDGACLALEHPERTEIRLNGRRVEASPDGWYVDKAIQTVPLPPIPAGETELLLTIPFGVQTAVEWCYLLGDFGVTLTGDRARLTAPVRALRYGDIVPQGLPFYTGNVIYHGEVDMPGGSCFLRLPAFRSPVLGISLDGKPVGRVAFAPYRLSLGAPNRGKHRLNITLYGNRHNGFGPVHSLENFMRGYGPGSWFTEGAARCEEYQLRPNGILTPPVIEWD